MNKALNYFYGNELAANVWAGKYSLRNKKGIQIEEIPDEMHKRMAKEFARIEAKYGSNQLSEDFIYDLFRNFGKVIPQGSVMAILGNPNQIGSLSNCIVLPELHDSYGGILYADQQLVQLMKRRCGVGLDISNLRPKGSYVSNAAQTSTGAVSFMHRFSNSCREVAQDGRRGAEMITMHINHPESEDFALIKQDLTKVTGANISLKISDEFMEAVQGNKMFMQRWPINAPSIEFDTDKDIVEDNVYVTGTDKDYTKYVARNANKLWNTIVKSAHNTAEPGLIYWDRQHFYSTSSIYPEFKNISTNPCSEIAMGNDSCRLIAKNMFHCVKYPFTDKAYFDFEEWYNTAYNTMRLMDDLVDLELEAIERIITKIKSDKQPDKVKRVELETWEQLYKTGQRGRRTGSGFTALGDTLAALGLKYSSKEGIEMAEKIAKIKFVADLDSTIDMAEQRGAFEAFDAKLEAEWSEDDRSMFYMIRNEFPMQWEKMQRVGRRNISFSTVAPNGSLSLLALLAIMNKAGFFGTTSGIEPLFSVFHIRKKKIVGDSNERVDEVDSLGDKWQYFPVFHEGFKMWFQINYPEQNIYDLTKEEIQKYVELSPYHNSTAPEIDWYQRIEMQSAIQKYITHSISSTINLPKDVTTDEVSNIYFEAWRQGLKGITVYRDGSRSGVLVTDTSKKEEFTYHDAPKRPKQIDAQLHNVTVKGQSYGVVIGFLDNRPYEVFAFQNDPKHLTIKEMKGKILKSGKGRYLFCDNLGVVVSEDNIARKALHPDEQMLTRLVSGMMRHGVNPKFIVEQIDKCPLEVVSFGAALKRIIKKYIPENELLERHKCKDCGGNNIRFEEGCAKCLDCGSSKCG